MTAAAHPDSQEAPLSWLPVLACVLSTSVLVAALASSLTSLRSVEVDLVAGTGSAPVARLALTDQAVTSSWSAGGGPGFVDVERSTPSDWTLAVLPAGGSDGTLAVSSCPVPWSADGRCAGAAQEVVVAAPLSSLADATALDLGAAAVAHLRVTLTAEASLVLSPA